MLRKLAGLGLALGLAFTGAAVSPVSALEEEVRSERTSTVLLDAASADAGKKEEVAEVAPLEGAFSFVSLNSNVEVASADASKHEEVVAQATPHALDGESEAAAPVAANNVVPFERVRRHSDAPPGVLVVAGRPAEQEVAQDPRSGQLKNSRVDISVHDDFWEKLRRERIAEAEKRALNQEEPALSSTSSEVTPAPQVEETAAQPNAPPSQEGDQAETDSAESNREMVGVKNEPSTEVEGEAQNQEEPASPEIEVEPGEEVIEIQEEPTSSPNLESEPVQTQETQEELNKTGSDSATEQGGNTVDEGAQVEAPEATEDQKVNLEVQETSKNEALEDGNSSADSEETPTDESADSAVEALESVETENLGAQEAPSNEVSGDGNPDADLIETIPADSSKNGADDSLESVEEEIVEGGLPEISTSIGVTGVGDEEGVTMLETGVGFAQDDVSIVAIVKTPVGGGEEDETAVDVETTLPLSEMTSISLSAEDLLSDSSTIKASLDILPLKGVVISPGVEKVSNEALKYNLSAALQATENLALAFDIEGVAAEPVFNFESNLVLGEHEVVARVNDVSAANARTFDLEGSFQVIEWAKARVKFESIFDSPIVGFGSDIQLNRSTELNVSVNDAFGSQTYDVKIKYTFGL